MYLVLYVTSKHFFESFIAAIARFPPLAAACI